MSFVSVTKARKSLSELVAQVRHEPSVLIKDSEPVAVLVSVDEYRALVVARRLASDPERLLELHAAHRVAERDESSFVDLGLGRSEPASDEYRAAEPPRRLEVAEAPASEEDDEATSEEPYAR